jgi:uncharacterized membrane protein YGL010W
MGFFDLEGALGFYGSYHNNRINQLIHVIFVPCIVWSFMVVLNYFSLDMILGHHVYLFGAKASTTYPLLAPINDNLVLGLNCLFYLAISAYYIKLAPFPGFTYDCIMFGMLVSSGWFFQHVTNAWTYALALHVLSWYMQIHPGHGIFEKRAAALTDNFFGGLSLGPLFAWYEVLFTLGWNPTLRVKLQATIDKNIADWKASQGSQAKKVK